MFTKPTPFAPALQTLRKRGLLPTTLSSAELSQLPADLRARALFSARTANAAYLSDMQKNLDALLQTGQYDAAGKLIPGTSVNPAKTRLALKDALRAISYAPSEAERGGITDLSSDARLDLIIQMQTD
ncbi:MAG: hypothetical protein HY343_05725, partial [Lentisphaerae bacterium]|nr:hypothetical protein [Lentisphaerota bacterium]